MPHSSASPAGRTATGASTPRDGRGSMPTAPPVPQRRIHCAAPRTIRTIVHDIDPSARLPMPISDALIDRHWDDDIVPQLTDYIRVPAKSPALRPALGGATATSTRVVRQAEAWVRRQPVRGSSSEIVRLRGPHAGAVLRGAGEPRRARRRDGAAVRPPRQAARDARLARRPRAVDPGDRGRQALRPRRRRRRLRGVRVAGGDRARCRRRACRTRAASA